MLNDDNLEVAPELHRTLEGLLARPLIKGVAQVLQVLPVDEGGEGEGLPEPHDLLGPVGLEEGGVHLLPPVDVVPHPIVINSSLIESVGPDSLDGAPQQPVDSLGFCLDGAERAGGVAREEDILESLLLRDNRNLMSSLSLS